MIIHDIFYPLLPFSSYCINEACNLSDKYILLFPLKNLIALCFIWDIVRHWIFGHKIKTKRT